MGLVFLTTNFLQAEKVVSSVSTPSKTPTKVEAAPKEYKEIHTEELRSLLKSNPSVVLIDVRSLDDGTRIPGAKFMPYDTKEEVILANLPDKNATIVVYCVSVECPVSKFMAKRLAKMGYKNVYKFPEGIEGWEASGNPIDKVEAAKK